MLWSEYNDNWKSHKTNNRGGKIIQYVISCHGLCTFCSHGLLPGLGILIQPEKKTKKKSLGMEFLVWLAYNVSVLERKLRHTFLSNADMNYSFKYQYICIYKWIRGGLWSIACSISSLFLIISPSTPIMAAIKVHGNALSTTTMRVLSTLYEKKLDHEFCWEI